MPAHEAYWRCRESSPPAYTLTASKILARLKPSGQRSVRRTSGLSRKSFSCQSPSNVVHIGLAGRELDHRVLAGFHGLHRPQLIQPVLRHLLAEDLHLDGLFDDFLGDRNDGDLLHDADAVFRRELDDSKTLLGRELDIELLLGIAEDVLRMQSVQLESGLSAHRRDRRQDLEDGAPFVDRKSVV